MNTLEKIQWIKEHKYAYPNYEELLSILEKLHQQESRFTKDDLLRLARKIKPVMREDKNKTVGIAPIAQGENLFWIPPYPIHSQSFIGWCSTPIKKAEGLKEIARVTTYHTYGGYHGFLRPSTDEAICQCPEDILERVCAFEFQSSSPYISDIYNNGLDRHVLTTIYYEGQLPADIADQDVSW